MHRFAGALALSIAVLAVPVGVAAQSASGEAGQERPPAQQIIEVPSPILTLDWEELYTRSAWGNRVAADLEAASSALNRENTRIADGLVEEERSLTERRAKMDPEAFRTEADAFDQRVIGIRRAQETKARSLSAQADSERSRFISAAIGLLDAMIEARGAVVVIDRRAIIRGAGAVDVTDEMVMRVDAALGDGQAVPDQTEAPVTLPTTPPSTTPSPADQQTAAPQGAEQGDSAPASDAPVLTQDPKPVAKPSQSAP